MVGERIEGFTISGKVCPNRSFILQTAEKTGANALVIDSFCIVFGDSSILDPLVDENHTTERTDEKSDRRHRQPDR